MSVQITGEYLGNKKIRLTHGPSGAELITVPPVDNQGDGSSFSPTDLVAAALASCILTIMAIVAERHQINIAGMHIQIEKNMHAEPRRIASLPVKIRLPDHLSQVDRRKLENAAHHCPVHRSLQPEIEIAIEFIYN